jgi:type IV pilus assembly protein PilC
MPAIDLRKYERKNAGNERKPSGDISSLSELLNREITFGNGELEDRKKEQLYLELSYLLEAGVDIKTALELIAADQKKKDNVLFLRIVADVVSGVPLSDALKRTGKFSLYEVFSLQIGEESGKTIPVLKDLAQYYGAKIKQRRKVISALTYPVIVLCTAFGAIFFMLRFVVPVFNDIFKRFGGELPWITRQILRLSQLIGNEFWLVALLSAAVFAFARSQRKTDTYRRYSAILLLKTPVIGPLIQKVYLARLCNSMRLLINAEVPLLKAIALIRQMIMFFPIQSSLSLIEKDLLKGRSLHESLSTFPIYPPKLVQLVRIGEETNQLDVFFGKVAEQYIEEVEFRSSTLNNAMQPLIIILLGIIIGGIMVALYLPLFQMSNNFQ